MNWDKPFILAVMVVILAASGYGFILSRGSEGIAKFDGVIIGGIISSLTTSLGLVLNYYFGSSSGSVTKSETLKNLRKRDTDSGLGSLDPSLDSNSGSSTTGTQDTTITRHFETKGPVVADAPANPTPIIVQKIEEPVTVKEEGK